MEPDTTTDKTPEEQKPTFDWSLYFAIGVFMLVCAGMIYLVLPQDGAPGGPVVENYGPWQFEQEGPLWKTLYQRNGQTYDIRFRYLPQEVDNITVRGTQARLVPPFYLTFDPNVTDQTAPYLNLAIADATAKLSGIYGERPVVACTTNETDPSCLSVPTITCDTPNASAIVLLEEDEPSVTLSGRCIILAGTGPDLYRAETLMWYRLLGIVRDE